MDSNIWHARRTWSIAAGVAAITCATAAFCQEQPAQSNQGDWVKAEAKKAQEDVDKAVQARDVAWDALRAAEKATRDSQKSEIQILRLSAEQRASRQREYERLDQKLLDAKNDMTLKMDAERKAKDRLTSVQRRTTSSVTQLPADDQPDVGRKLPPAGQTQSRFHNSLGALKGRLGPTYDWVQRIAIATKGELKAEVPREPGPWMRPDATRPNAVIDPYDVVHRNVQEEWNRDPYVAVGPTGGAKPITPTGPPQTSVTTTKPKPGVTNNAALLAQIARQKEKVAKLRSDVQMTDVYPYRGELERKLRNAEEELKRLEAQLNASR